LASVDEIRDLLSWPDVRPVVYSEYGMTYIRVVPERSKLPPIEFAFSGDLDFLQSFGFGEWHTHSNFDEALVMVTCSPKSDPGVMRVYGPCGGKETLDEAQEAQSRAGRA
jgi:hypothetical protein